MKPSLGIVIVNWNSGEYLTECLKSLSMADRTDFELNRVIVVDNASTDGSTIAVDGADLPLTVIRNAVNRGFASACNQGAKGTEADYLLFLNPDALLFELSLARPIAFLERPENECTGIIGIQLVDENRRVTRTCARFPTPGRFWSKMFGLDRLLPKKFPAHFLTDWDHCESRPVDQVMGAFFMVRRSLFEALDGFDERFFVYFEEVDFSLRAWRAGWQSFYLADAQAYHKGGGSTNQVRAESLYFSLRSRIQYGFKHFSLASATCLMLGTLMIEPLTRFAWGIAHACTDELLWTLEAYGRLWGWILSSKKDGQRLRQT